MKTLIHFRRGAPRKSAGVGLVTAIFLLVVLAGLGVAMVTVFTSQQAGSAMDVQGARAYQAARAGIEWGLFRQLRNDSCEPLRSFALPAGGALDGFVVTVTCSAVPGPTPALTRWVLAATACNLQPPGGACPAQSSNPGYVQRRLEVRL